MSGFVYQRNRRMLFHHIPLLLDTDLIPSDSLLIMNRSHMSTTLSNEAWRLAKSKVFKLNPPNVQEWNGMEYVIWAKGPALGPVRSFSADREREKRPLKPPHDDNRLDIEGADFQEPEDMVVPMLSF